MSFRWPTFNQRIVLTTEPPSKHPNILVCHSIRISCRPHSATVPQTLASLPWYRGRGRRGSGERSKCQLEWGNLHTNIFISVFFFSFVPERLISTFCLPTLSNYLRKKKNKTWRDSWIIYENKLKARQSLAAKPTGWKSQW